MLLLSFTRSHVAVLVPVIFVLKFPSRGVVVVVVLVFTTVVVVALVLGLEVAIGSQSTRGPHTAGTVFVALGGSLAVGRIVTVGKDAKGRLLLGPVVPAVKILGPNQRESGGNDQLGVFGLRFEMDHERVSDEAGVLVPTPSLAKFGLGRWFGSRFRARFLSYLFLGRRRGGAIGLTGSSSSRRIRTIGSQRRSFLTTTTCCLLLPVVWEAERPTGERPPRLWCTAPTSSTPHCRANPTAAPAYRDQRRPWPQWFPLLQDGNLRHFVFRTGVIKGALFRRGRAPLDVPPHAVVSEQVDLYRVLLLRRRFKVGAQHDGSQLGKVLVDVLGLQLDVGGARKVVARAQQPHHVLVGDPGVGEGGHVLVQPHVGLQNEATQAPGCGATTSRIGSTTGGAAVFLSGTGEHDG